MKTLIATALTLATLGAHAATSAETLKTLKLSDQAASLAQQIPAAVGDFKVSGPIFTREVVGYDYNLDEPIYGEINGVVKTLEVVGYDYAEDEAIYGSADGLALGLSLTPEQIRQRDLDD